MAWGQGLAAPKGDLDFLNLRFSSNHKVGVMVYVLHGIVVGTKSYNVDQALSTIRLTHSIKISWEGSELYSFEF